MSTEYKILEKGGLTVSLDEQSTLFDVCMTADPPAELYAYDVEGETVTTRRITDTGSRKPDLTPADLVAMAFGMLKVASYHGDLPTLVAAYLGDTSDFSYERQLARQVAVAVEAKAPDSPA